MSQTNNSGSSGSRRLTPEQRRRILEMRRRKQRKKQLMIIAPALAAVVVIAVVLALTLPVGNRNDRNVAPEQPVDEPAISDAVADPEDGEVPAEGDVTGEDMEAGETAEPEATEAPIQTGEAYTPAGGTFVYDDAYVAAALGKNTGPLITADLSKVDPLMADRWPEASEGYLPVLYQANTTENIVAITVDDCFQGENLQKIIQCALDNTGKLTIFPIGDNLKRENVASAVKWAWENGFEIENHTYNHAGMYHYDDQRMTQEMWYQNVKLSQVLGVNYQEHFFRPKGGDERIDQRVHAYANQMGMQGIAIWTQSGSSSELSSLKIKPGAIFLFHTTDKDLSKLLQFIPQVAQAGYRMVTLNEMFGLPENETSDLSTVSTDVPALEPFRIIPATLQKTSYIRAAAIVQKRLIELGWLEGEADGVYGQSSFMATGYFQLAADIKADGKAGASTQALLFSDDAPAATDENVAKVKAMISK